MAEGCDRIRTVTVHLAAGLVGAGGLENPDEHVPVNHETIRSFTAP